VTEGDRENLEQRVLVLAPTSKDASLTASLLGRAGVTCVCCSDLPQLCHEIEAGAGAVLLPEEAVGPDRKSCLGEWLARQPRWSDLPILILSRPGADSAAVAQSMDLLGNVTVLERPTRVAALVSAVRTALGARRRQYEARAHLSQIERSERELRDFFDNASVGLHWVGPDGIILRVNQTELNMLGYTHEEYIGRHIAEFHADPPVISDILQRLTAGETLRNVEARMRCKDGSLKHVLIDSNVLWEDGRFVHTRCFTRDVTELKTAEEARARLAAIVTSSADAIISKTLDGIILTWNAGAERLFGYSAAEVIGRPITLLIPPDRRHEEKMILERVRRGERIEHFETVRVHKDGRRIDISLTVSPVRDAGGRIIAASKVARDITPRKQAEAELKVLSLLPTQNPSPVLRIARDGTLLYANPGAVSDLSEWSLQVGETVPESLRALMVPPTNGALVFERDQSVAGREFLVTVAFVPDADYANLYWTDITKRKKAERALKEADRRKDEFLAVLAHELRNPLAPIRNSLHILRLSAQHDPVAERIGEMMERQVNHMVRLVDDLLEVSRITRGKIELHKESVELAAIVRSAVETSRPLIDAAGHELALSIPADPLTLEGDSVRLAQVLANLLNNAAKYTEPGGHIWLTARREVDEVVISVRDTGVGIPPEMLPRVFELFTQLDRHADRAQGGLGIGLTLVKSLVEMHGGSVEASSEGAGRGSEFVVRLPLGTAALPTHDPGKAARPSDVLALRRVLVVDDNRDAAESLSMLLKLLGADVHVAYNGPDALEALAKYKPAVVLLDIGMPGMDGHEVARRIRQQSEFQDVTLIALTGWGQEADRQRSQSAGFDYHLIKPADVDALQNLLISVEDRRGDR
jgi:PAS domain S-box-containing protein